MSLPETVSACRRSAAGGETLLEHGLEALVDCAGLERLSRINFLGLLGYDSGRPRFSRAQHSFGVVHLTSIMLRDAPYDVFRHALVASLLHDAAQWALSHTCEGVMESVSRVTSKALLHAMLFDEPAIDSQYHVGGLLAEAEIFPEAVWQLLWQKRTAAETLRQTPWSVAAAAFACPLNPDTLDGITRAATTFGVPCPDPATIARAFDVRSGRLQFPVERLVLGDLFWAAKGKVYSEHIHSRRSLSTEVHASAVAVEELTGLDSHHLFALRDDDLLTLFSRRESDHSAVEADVALLFRLPRRYRVRRAVFDSECLDALDLSHRYCSSAVNVKNGGKGTRPTLPDFHYDFVRGAWSRSTSEYRIAAPRESRLREASGLLSVQ